MLRVVARRVGGAKGKVGAIASAVTLLRRSVNGIPTLGQEQSSRVIRRVMGCAEDTGHHATEGAGRCVVLNGRQLADPLHLSIRDLIGRQTSGWCAGPPPRCRSGPFRCGLIRRQEEGHTPTREDEAQNGRLHCAARLPSGSREDMTQREACHGDCCEHEDTGHCEAGNALDEFHGRSVAEASYRRVNRAWHW